MIKENKVLGGHFFGYNMKKAYQEFIRVALKNKPWAFIRNISNGNDVADRLDDLASPVVSVSNVGVTTATLTWSAIPKATGYRIDPLGVATDDLTYQLTGLAGGSNNDFTVVAVGDYNVTGTSQTVNVKTKLSAPASTSTSNITATSFRLNWTGIAGNTYIIDVSTNSNFTGAQSFTVAGTAGAQNYNVTGRTASTQYYWRIKATKTDYPESNYSSGNVTTIAA